MTVAPPGWQPDPNQSPKPQSFEAGAGQSVSASQFTAYEAPPPATAVSGIASGSSPRFVAAAQPTLVQRNSLTFTAIVVVALYLVLASTTGIVLIGIFPAMLAFRAYQRREPLAALAVAAAAVAIIFSITVLTRH